MTQHKPWPSRRLECSQLCSMGFQPPTQTSKIIEKLTFKALTTVFTMVGAQMKYFTKSVLHVLGQFISIFIDMNHSVKFQDLKLSRKTR